jgi:hypothetical protein
MEKKKRKRRRKKLVMRKTMKSSFRLFNAPRVRA